jgi:hypothetical protein
MLFRTSQGSLIEINKNSFKNDTLYYEKLIDIKKIPKLEKGFNNKNNKQTNK